MRYEKKGVLIMKRIMTWLLTLAFVLCTIGACAGTNGLTFEELARADWSFCSGAGGWSTDMQIRSDGSFTGTFHDSEMGESAETYPNGTVYFCSFSGLMTITERIDENTWKVYINELTKDETESEAIDDGIRFVASEIYGLSEGDEMTLYGPETKLSAIPEEMVIWTHALDFEEKPETIGAWFLSSEKNESGFIGTVFADGVGIANPWAEMTAEELAQASGIDFQVPEGAENTVYRYLGSEGLAEMLFDFETDRFCARVRPVEPGNGGMTDISGMYYDWDHEEEVTVGRCRGTLCWVQTDGGEQAALCEWYDAASGRIYAISVTGEDLDGLDLVAVAEEVFVPAQDV